MTATTFDVHAARQQFPQLADGMAFLDNAAGGLMPQRAIDAVTRFLTRHGAMNAGMGYAQSEHVLDIKLRARERTAAYLNCTPGEVVLGPSASALAFRLSVAFARLWGPGDEVIISELEHEANASPWRELERVGVTVKVWRARLPDLTLHVEDLCALLTDRTRLLAVCAASNSVGVTPPVTEAVAAAREAGAWSIVDAVHSAPHHLPDVRAWGAEFVMFSPYKVFAPHLGALFVQEGLLDGLPAQKLEFVPDGEPAKMEHGTSQYELLAGWLGSLAYLADLGGSGDVTRAALERTYRSIEAHERELTRAMIEGLLDAPRVTLYGPRGTEGRVGTAAFRVAGRSPREVAAHLSEQGVCVASGHYYAVMPIRALGLYPEGVVRASLAHYNTPQDVARLVEGVRSIK